MNLILSLLLSIANSAYSQVTVYPQPVDNAPIRPTTVTVQNLLTTPVLIVGGSTFSVVVATFDARFNEVAVSTNFTNTRLNDVAISTNALSVSTSNLSNRLIEVATSTNSLNSRLNEVAVSTNFTNTRLSDVYASTNALSASTSSLSNRLDEVAVSTNFTNTRLNAVALSTNALSASTVTLSGRLDEVAVSTNFTNTRFASVSASTNALSASTVSLSGRIDELTTSTSNFNSRFNEVAASTNALSASTVSLSGRLDQVATSTTSFNSRFNEVATSTNSLNSRLNEVAVSTNATNSRFNEVATSTNSLSSRLDEVAVSTNFTNTRFASVASSTNSLSASTVSLSGRLDQVATSTNSFNSRFNEVATSTNSLNSRLNEVATSTNSFNSRFSEVATATNTLSASTASLDSSKLNRSGDSTTGQFTVGSGSTLTVQGNAFSVGTSTFSVNNGRVGIGMTNPGSALEITGETRISARLRVGASGIDIDSDTGVGGGIGLGQGQSFSWNSNNDGSGSDTALVRNSAGVVEVNNGTAGAFRDMRLRAVNPTTGNLGIGTTSPSTKLHMSSGIFTLDGTSGMDIGQAPITSTVTIQGNAFSVGGSTFIIKHSSIGIRQENPQAAVHLSSGMLLIDGIANQTRLKVHGFAHFQGTNLNVRFLEEAGALYVDLDRQPNGEGSLVFATQGVRNYYLGHRNSDGTDNFHLYSAAVAKDIMNIRPTGQFGFGSLNANEKIHVSTGGVFVDGSTAFFDTTGSYKIDGAVSYSSVPVFTAGAALTASLTSGVTFYAFTVPSAITLIGITTTIQVAGVAGAGDTVRCNDASNNGLEVTSAAAAAAGTVTDTFGSVNIAASTRINCHIESAATTKPNLSLALIYRMQ